MKRFRDFEVLCGPVRELARLELVLGEIEVELMEFMVGGRVIV